MPSWSVSSCSLRRRPLRVPLKLKQDSTDGCIVSYITYDAPVIINNPLITSPLNVPRSPDDSVPRSPDDSVPRSPDDYITRFKPFPPSFLLFFLSFFQKKNISTSKKKHINSLRCRRHVQLPLRMHQGEAIPFLFQS